MTNIPPTNLEILKKSRKKVLPGDIFTLKLRGVGYFWGRVVRTDSQCGFGDRFLAILIYIYSEITESKEIPQNLRKENLIIPPECINRLPWSCGYFETIENRPIMEGDVYPRHCFKTSVYKEPRYYDEFGIQILQPFEPCGYRGLSSYRVVDDTLSKLMGIPVAPEK